MATKKPEIEYLATGRRKTAIAQVRLFKGDGTITVNGRAFADYFPTTDVQLLVEAPFKALEAMGQYDVIAKCVGGGAVGQITRLLVNTPATLSPVLHPKEEHVEFKDSERQCGFLEPFLQEEMGVSCLACLLQPHHSCPSSHRLLLLSTLISFSLSPGPSMVSLLVKTNFTSFFSQITSPFLLLSLT